MYEIYWGDKMVAFSSILNMPSGVMKNAFREHRLVVLPDFQGLGFGTKISEFLGEYLLNNGNRFFSRSTHIRLGRHRSESNLWIPTSTNQIVVENLNDPNQSRMKSNKYKKYDAQRTAYSFEYVGKNFNKLPHQRIICIDDTPYDYAKEIIIGLLNENKHPIIISGVASSKANTSWEIVAKEIGIRTEIAYLKKFDKNKEEYYVFNKSTLSGTCDYLIIKECNLKKLDELKDLNILNIIKVND